MPVELPATVITGRRPDFSPISAKPIVEPMDPQAQDTLDWLIRSSNYVEGWMAEKREEINNQHEKNLAAIDAELGK